jgi:hypothetical protein
LTTIYNNQTKRWNPKICCVHTRVTFCPVTLEHAYKSHESFLAFACYWTTTCVIQGNQRIFQISFFLNAFCFLGSISPLQKKKKIHYCLSLGFKEPNYWLVIGDIPFGIPMFFIYDLDSNVDLTSHTPPWN